MPAAPASACDDWKAEDLLARSGRVRSGVRVCWRSRLFRRARIGELRAMLWALTGRRFANGAFAITWMVRTVFAIVGARAGRAGWRASSWRWGSGRPESPRDGAGRVPVGVRVACDIGGSGSVGAAALARGSAARLRVATAMADAACGPACRRPQPARPYGRTGRTVGAHCVNEQMIEDAGISGSSAGFVSRLAENFHRPCGSRGDLGQGGRGR